VHCSSAWRRAPLAGRVARRAAAGAAFRRARHRTVARVLAALDAGALREFRCWFGGGTRIALELGEYRESQDVDFLCADLGGYREMRAGIGERSLGALLPKAPPGIGFLREVRADQYGFRTVLSVDGEPVKFEIILEARIALQAGHVAAVPVDALDRVSCFAEKWLANADRWGDVSVMGRDAIDLAFMLIFWKEADALAGAALASQAYGAAVAKAAVAASAKLRTDLTWRRRCTAGLAIEDTARLAAGLKKLSALAAALPRGD